jgi:hypothetical protein
LLLFRTLLSPVPENPKQKLLIGFWLQ